MQKIPKLRKLKPKDKKHKIIRVKPLTSLEELEKTRKEINAINRRRAKEMERRIARYLKGKRVPSSGAIAGMKGDCVIPVSDGHYYVECKLSAQEDQFGQAKMLIAMSWFDKIIKDAQAMNSRFGILVIHYHGKKEDYVFVPERAIGSYLSTRSQERMTLDVIRTFVVPVDLRETNGKLRSTYELHLHKLESWFVDVRGIKSAAILTRYGIWYIFTLQQWRDLLEGV